jgi:CubicO group peptidase (beta-lactamase class C family)
MIIRAIVVSVLLPLSSQTTPAQQQTSRLPIDAAALSVLLDSLVPAAMKAEQIPGAVVSVVSDGRTIFERGYGFADLESRRRMSPDSTIVRIGSTSKVMTAVAVAQLADRGRIRLDVDVNRYLKSLKIPATYPAPITVFNLLTHTAALDEIRPGTQAERREDLMPLREFLKPRLVRYAPPGTATAYSTYGMTVAGLLVEDVSGQRFEDYLTRNVWLPLGMMHTSITVSAADQHLVAVPYDVENGKPVKAPWEWYHTTPASSVNSTASDMSRFMIAQLGGDTIVLSRKMLAEMQRQQVTMHPLVPGYGLAWQQVVMNGERGVQHGGDVAGFSSLMTLLPSRGVGIFVAGHREGSDLRYTVTRGIVNRFFRDSNPVAAPKSMYASVSQAAAAAARFAGHYRANIVCHSCASPRPVSEADIVANDDGTLSMNGIRWIEVSPRFFRSMDGTRRMGFREDSAGRITHFTAGSWQVMERVPLRGTAVDSAGIRAAAMDYIEGWYNGDAERMGRAVHPELAKRRLRADNGRLDQMSAMSLVRGTGRGGGKDTPESERRRDVMILDIYGNAASARTTMSGWIDYMHLVRADGRWQIVNVLWELSPADDTAPKR